MSGEGYICCRIGGEPTEVLKIAYSDFMYFGVGWDRIDRCIGMVFTVGQEAWVSEQWERRYGFELQ